MPLSTIFQFYQWFLIFFFWPLHSLVSVIKQLSWYEKWSLIFMCNYVALYSRNCYHLYKSSINLRLLICFPWNGLHIASPVILWEIHSCKISQWQYIVYSFVVSFCVCFFCVAFSPGSHFMSI
jgi:hypothetical protein